MLPCQPNTVFIVDTFDDQIADPDSGMSTSHSPEENFKQFQQMQDEDTLSPVSPALDTAATRLELLDPTHRGLHRWDSSEPASNQLSLLQVRPEAQGRDYYRHRRSCLCARGG